MNARLADDGVFDEGKLPGASTKADAPSMPAAAFTLGAPGDADNDSLLEAIIRSYDDEAYPAEFLERFTLVECLAERLGVDTFVAIDDEGKHYVAKCYDKSTWSVGERDTLLQSLDHPGLPVFSGSYENDETIVIVREFVEGVSLERHARENDLSEQQIVQLCVKLCDILAYLHHRDEPIIHRDIKPQNVIVGSDGTITLIDFDIARVYRSENDTDTRFFGTVAYAPPEQYGFSQTDARADIYALGVLLRYLLTGSTRDNKNVHVYRPLAKIIARCTAFSPNERYASVDQVKKALLNANPRSQALRITGIVAAVLAALVLVGFACVRVYQVVTYSPFNSDALPAVLNDDERVDDAVAYMKGKYHTNLFDGDDGDIATVGLLRSVLIEVYGLDREYVYNFQEEGLPGESDKFFMPWGWDDGQTVRLETAVYAAVKVHDPTLVAEEQWSKLEDDNGEYPGARVAMMFAEDAGILTGANRPYDITVGELALVFANADRVFDAAK